MPDFTKGPDQFVRKAQAQTSPAATNIAPRGERERAATAFLVTTDGDSLSRPASHRRQRNPLTRQPNANGALR
jgi:hypothetical protein